MRERLARLISNVLNPFLVSFIVIILLAVESTENTGEALKWALLSIVLSVLPVFVVVTYLVHQKKLEGMFANPRHQRNGIYILASILGALGCGVMWWCNAPRLIAVAFSSGLISIVIFMIINRFWKISLHTAFISASVTLITVIYGAYGALTILLLPLVAWARIRLNQHSPTQVITGALLSTAILLAMFWGFGLL